VRRDGAPAEASRLVVHENVMAALLDAELVRTTELLDAGTRRGQGQTVEADRRRFSSANGVLSRPAGTPPFAWLVGHRPSFDLDVLAPQERVLELHLSNGISGSQRVTVLFNGQALGDRQLPPGAALTVLQYPVPAALQWRGRNTVELLFDEVETRLLFGELVPLPVSGVLTHVRFLPPGAPDEVPPPPELAGVITEGAGSEARSVLLLPAGTVSRVPLELPAAPRVALRFTPLELGLPLELSVLTDAGKRTLLRTFQPGRAAAEARFDLTPWAGTPVLLEAWARDDGEPGTRDRRVRLGAMQVLVPETWRDLTAATSGAAGREEPSGAALSGEAPSDDAARGHRPSFLVVTLDALAARWASTVHRGHVTTPHLDALVRRGTSFPGARTLSSYTLAAVGTLLTGQEPLHHGVALLEDEQGALQRLLPCAPRVAALLREGGWRTAAFMTNPNTAKEHGYAEGFQRFDELFRDSELFREGVDGAHLPPRLQAFLDESAGAPFLAWVHVFQPHAPYEAPEDLTTRFVAPYEGPVGGTRAWINAYRGSELAVDEAGWSHLRDLYAARVALADRVLGELLEVLAASGRDQDTVVIVLSDHGESLGEHGALEHGDELWSEQVDVPLVIAVPGRGPARRPGPASLADVAPTMLALAGLSAPEAMDGSDLLAGALDPARGQLARSAAQVPVLSWTAGDLRLVVDLSTRRRALYDLARDPGETVDLLDERPVTAALMFRELCAEVCAAEALRTREALACTGDGDGGLSDPASLREDRERLEQITTLGYLQAAAPASLARGATGLCAQLRAMLVRL
jgi:arylsulfatase A-like enzyme